MCERRGTQPRCATRGPWRKGFLGENLLIPPAIYMEMKGRLSVKGGEHRIQISLAWHQGDFESAKH